jgi:hypothetical protein
VNKLIGKVTEDLKAKLGDQLGGSVGQILNDPNKLKEDPAKAIQERLGRPPEQGQVRWLDHPAVAEAGHAEGDRAGSGGLLNKKKPAATQPK